MSSEGSPERRPSAARRLAELQDEIRAGQAVPRRKRLENPLVAAEAADEDEYAPSEVAEDEERYEFVSGDDEGEAYERHSTAKKRRSSSGPRGPDQPPKQKDLSRLVVHSKGEDIEAVDGVVRINLAKFVLTQITEDRLKELKRERVRGFDKLSTNSSWECSLWSSTANRKHPRFVEADYNSTGNLMRHMTTWHAELLDGMKRLVAEIPKNEAKVAIPKFIAKQALPQGNLSRLFRRRAGPEQMDRETRALLWFLDGQIPFDNFDNPFFRAFLRSMQIGQSDFGSATTIVASLLPSIYVYVTREILTFFRSCRAIFNSSDGWSRFGDKFVSQHYHAIEPKGFTYRVFMLDLVPYTLGMFAEALAGALAERRNHWLNDLDVLTAGGIADAEAKGQAAGKIAFGDDMLKCQNHRLKKTYEVAEDGSTQFKLDLAAFVALCTAAASKGPASEILWAFQRQHDLAELSFLLYNETRWEGRFIVMDRAVELEDALVPNEAMQVLDVVVLQREKVPDFLKPDYFYRAKSYLPLLTDLNNVSKLYQSQKFPSGCFVVLLSYWAKCRAAPNPAMDPAYLTEFKQQFADSIDRYLFQPSLTDDEGRPTLWLMGALLHPGVARVVESFVPEALISEAYEVIADEAYRMTSDGDDEEWVADDAVADFSRGLRLYRKKVVGDKLDFDTNFDWAPLWESGTFGGESALEFWRSVAEREHPFEGSLGRLLPVASMLLAIPAGESVDEFSFSSSQRTLTKERNSLKGVTVEMITVVRMFIRTSGIHPDKLVEWIQQAKEEAKQQEDDQDAAAAQ